jgi:hypothetical protein
VEVRAALTDLVGNTSDRLLTTIDVDVTLPAAPDVDTPGLVSVRRAPWGADDTGGARSQVLTGAASAAEAGTTLLWWSEPSGAVELGRDVVAGDGSFGPLTLLAVDLRDTYVVAVDSSGNASPVVRVRDGQWVATLGGKIAGLDYPNPHSFVTRTSSVPTTWLDRRGAPRAGGLERGGDEVALADANAHRTEGGFWTRRYSGADTAVTPPNRPFHAQAYDSIRGRVVIVGGECVDCADTWEWDGQRWQERESTQKPSRLIGSAAAFDPVLGATVLFGGRVGGFGTPFHIVSNETWLWDAEAWREVPGAADAAGLVERAFTHAVYVDMELTLKDTGEKVSGGVIVWGGTQFHLDPPVYPDMFVFLGDRWAEVDQGPNPTTGRAGAAVAYDPVNRVLVTNGGLGTPGTTTFDGTSWTDWPDATDPAFKYQNAAWDPIAGEVIQLGSDWETRQLNFQTWALTEPDGCAQLQLVHDDARAEMLAIGWLTENGAPDTGPDELEQLWTYRIGRPGTYVASPSQTPPRRQGARMVTYPFFVDYFPLLYGGVDDPLAPSPTVHAAPWMRTGSQWVEMEWIGSETLQRHHFAIAEPGSTGWAFAHGGETAGADNGDILTFHLFSGWGIADDAPEPPTRIGGAMARDTDSNRVILFGGRDAGGNLLDDTWELDPATDTWTLVPTTMAPSPREHHAMAYDPGLGAVLLFGGDAGAGPTDETWAYDDGDWAQVSTQTTPKPRALHTLTYHSPRQRVLMIGGESVGLVDEVAWSFDGSDWTPARIDGLPPNTSDHAASYDAGEQRVILFGGDSSVGGIDVTWDIFHAGRPGHAFAFELGASGVDPAWREQITMTVVAGGDGGERPTVIPGAALEVWHEGRFKRVVTHNAPAAAPATLSWQTDATIPISESTLFERTMVRVLPIGENDAEFAALETDYAELTLDYRLP